MGGHYWHRITGITSPVDFQKIPLDPGCLPGVRYLHQDSEVVSVFMSPGFRILSSPEPDFTLAFET